MRKKNTLVRGWGVNDADYAVYTLVNGRWVPCKFYRAWGSMLGRCYSKHKYPTYKGCKVCREWKSFMAFRPWTEKQDWEGKELDKDLLGSGKFYSPDTCCFVEGWLNSLYNDHGRAKGKWPLGVTFIKRRHKYQAQLNINGGRKHLGYFETPEEAHRTYKATKLEHVQSLMSDYPDQEIKKAVLTKAQHLYGEQP